MQVNKDKPSKPWRPVIAVDFDGVLHDYDGKWAPGLVTGAAIPGAMQWLKDAYFTSHFGDIKFEIAITSARSRYLTGRWAMKRWLYKRLIDEFGYQAGPSMDPLALEIFEWIKWPWFKPGAMAYIDDRAHCFTGEWPEVIDLLRFKPWNKLW